MLSKKKVGVGFISLLTIALILWSGFDASKSPCACGTINDEVIGILNMLDTAVQQHLKTHHGKYPTYKEFLSFARKITENNRNHPVTIVHFTNKVDTQTKQFTFKPDKNHTSYQPIYFKKYDITNTKLVCTIGYNVTNDQKSYVLLGVGKSTRKLFEIEFPEKFKYAYPTLYPHQKSPEPSPSM